jgi:hypothetical protein
MQQIPPDNEALYSRKRMDSVTTTLQDAGVENDTTWKRNGTTV